MNPERKALVDSMPANLSITQRKRILRGIFKYNLDKDPAFIASVGQITFEALDKATYDAKQQAKLIRVAIDHEAYRVNRERLAQKERDYYINMNQSYVAEREAWATYKDQLTVVNNIIVDVPVEAQLLKRFIGCPRRGWRSPTKLEDEYYTLDYKDQRLTVVSLLAESWIGERAVIKYPDYKPYLLIYQYSFNKESMERSFYKWLMQARVHVDTNRFTKLIDGVVESNVCALYRESMYKSLRDTDNVVKLINTKVLDHKTLYKSLSPAFLNCIEELIREGLCSYNTYND